MRLSLTGGQVGCMMYTSELRTFSRIWMLTWQPSEEGGWCVWRERWWGWSGVEAGVGLGGVGGGGEGGLWASFSSRGSRLRDARRCEGMRGDARRCEGMRTSPSAKREMVAGVSGTPSLADISSASSGLPLPASSCIGSLPPPPPMALPLAALGRRCLKSSTST